MKCLYISSTRHITAPYQDGSTRYRCYNFVEELIKLRYVAHVAPLVAVTPELLEQYDVAVFLRPEISQKLLELVNHCARKNICTIADFDDLIFEPDIAEQSPSVLAGRASAEDVAGVYGRHLDALRLFSRVTTATQSLQQRVTTLCNDTAVHYLPNGLSHSWLNLNNQFQQHVQRENQLLYMPGTRSHDHDFRCVAATMQALLKADHELRLKVLGPLSIRRGEFETGKLIKGPEWVDFAQLPEHISKARACLAPLANTAFNECKSHIKFIEAAAFGTPVLATPIPDMQRHSVEGLFFPESLNDWRKCMTNLKRADFFNHCSQTLHRYARDYCGNEQHIPALLSFYTTESTSVNSEVKTQQSIDLDQFVPSAVTLDCRGHARHSHLSRFRRKWLKLRQSPKHFFLDSKLLSLCLHRTTR